MKMEISVSNSNHELQELDLEDPTTPLTLKPTRSVGEKNGVNGKGKTTTTTTTTLEMVKDPQCNDDGTLRVLIYSTCYNIVDGVTLTIRKLEKEILESGGHLCILTTKSGNPDNTNLLVGTHPNRQVLFLDNSQIIPMQADPKNPKISYHLGLSLSRHIQEQVDQFDPKIIHITTPDCTALHLLNYARSKQIPLMGTYHSNIPDYMLFVPGLSWVKPILEVIFRHLYNFLQVLYVPTPFIRQTLTDQLQMDCVTNVKVWGRGVDLKKFSPSHRTNTFRQHLGIPNNTPIVLYVGRLVPEKRPDIFASVIRRLYNEKINFHAVIVGAGQSQHLIDNLPNTVHMGWLDGDQLSEAYASSDIFLFPSSVETFGNVTLEAAASGLPLVVEEKCSGHLVTNGVNGYTCEAGNVQSFYDGTLRLLRDANLRSSFSEQSKIMSQGMEQSSVVREMLGHYEEVKTEFYDTYGGSHQARDEAYRTPGSFKLGTDPRPFGFGLVEFIILSFFSFGVKILAVVTWCQERFGSHGSSSSGSGSYESVASTSTSSLNGLVENGRLEMSVVSSDDTDEENGGTATTKSSNINTISTAGIGSSMNDLDEVVDAGPGICISCMVTVGDSQIVLKSVHLLLVAIMFFFRTMSTLKLSCRKCCGSIQHRVDAYRGVSSKREV